MANNPIKFSEVRNHITLAHVLQARDALLNNGEKKGNLVYFKKNNTGGYYLVVFKGNNDNEYKPKELARIACLAYQNINLKSKSQIDENHDNLEEFNGGYQTHKFLNSLHSSEKEYIIYDKRTGEIIGEDNLVFDQKTRKIVSKDGTVAGLKATNEQGANEMDKYVKLLKQFKQVIFYGPPGTGKTYQAKATLKNMLDMENDSEFAESQGKRWDIVQFHPSYNYEDFVRGVQVKTEKGQVTYETKNRIFADMCVEASENKGNAYALIIDEINRANVSSVLGELIYALEYRGESVSTPYEIIGSRLLTIPPNLYIIGTMNTADRTIGALDYAVRRRFAFVHCSPDESLIEDAEAKSVFDKVTHIFDEFLSPDFDAADVEIGHSYFMAKGEELRGKIQYQVVPILDEYVKDGVLLETAKDKIDELWEMLDTGSTDSIHTWFCMNVGEHENRNWDDCREYGYLGGDGKKSVQQMKKHLRKGDWVFAFINGKGCVGYGEITQEAIPIREFVTQDGTPLLECELRAPKVKENSDNDDSCEWVVGVQWRKERDRENAVPVKAARGQTVWKEGDDETIQKLDDAFGLISCD